MYLLQIETAETTLQNYLLQVETAETPLQMYLLQMETAETTLQMHLLQMETSETTLQIAKIERRLLQSSPRKKILRNSIRPFFQHRSQRRRRIWRNHLRTQRRRT